MHQHYIKHCQVNESKAVKGRAVSKQDSSQIETEKIGKAHALSVKTYAVVCKANKPRPNV
jgi:hypothetical protein